MSAVFIKASRQYLQTNTVSVSDKPVTIAAWVKSTDLTAYQGVVSITNAGVSTQFLLLQLRGAVAGDPAAAMEYAGAWKLAESSSGYSSGTWHHVACTFVNSTQRSVFIDGGSKVTNTDNQAVNFGLLTSTLIGTHRIEVSGSFFEGKIAEVGIWSVELSDAEISSLADGDAPNTVQSESLEEYWSLYEDRLSDIGGNNLANSTGVTFDTSDHPISPAKATTPSPANAATDVTLDQATLTWVDGGSTDTFDVYYGTESGNLTKVSDAQAETSFTVTGITNGSPYVYLITRYWRIDSTTPSGTTTGDEWSFTTIRFTPPTKTYWYSTGGYYYKLLIQDDGTYGDPPPTGTEDTDYVVVTSTYNNMATTRRLVAAANDKIWYESI